MKTNAATRENLVAHKITALRRRLLPVLIAGCFGTAVANPLGPQVVNGQVNFNNQGNVLSVTNTPGAIINWQSFSINPGELTRFIQQNPNSAVLNRIIGQDPSKILGALQSNGRVFLINPNGILFGQGAQVDVNGLVASTLNISNEDFLSGKMNFKAGDKAGNLKNQGAITTPGGGQVYLVAPNVENSGIITSPQGEVLLAAGHSVQLVDSMNPDLHVVVSAPENEALNLGQVIAQGGKTGIYGALVKQRGIVSANSAVVGENGKVVLKASRDTLLEAGSRTTATGAGKGGEIHVLGERVGLAGDASIDASGALGGGTVLVGGDFQGKNADIRNAKQAFVGQEVEIKADATQNGDGGKVIVWSDDATRFYGAISAHGGKQSGNGGFVETSGKFLDMQGRVDTRAEHGVTGRFLLDPTNIFIAIDQANATAAGMVGTDVSVDSSGPANFLASGAVQDSLLTVSALQGALLSSDVTVSTANAPGTGAGIISVVDPVSWTTPQALSLSAAGGITIKSTISASDSGAQLALRTASGNITQNAAITVPSLFAYADLGSVTLNNAGNNVGTLAGFAGSAGTGFSFTNSNALTVGSVVTSLGTSHGIATNNNPINLSVASGNLTIDVDGSAPTYGVKAITGDVTLAAFGGTVLENIGVIVGNNLQVNSDDGISLTNNNAVSSFSAMQTDTNGGSVAFKNDAALSVTSVAQASTIASNISIETTSSNNLTVAGTITAGNASSVSLKAGTSGSLLRSGSGLVTANTIMLQNDSSGALGTSGTRFQTSSHVGGNASITIGATSGPGDVYLTHGGDATLNTMTVGASAPVEISAIGDLTASSITTAGSLSLTAGVLLTVPALKTLTAANITLTADRMALLNAAGATNAGVGVLRLIPKTSNWNIDLGASATDVAGNTLELSTNELDTLAGTGSLKIGALTAGDLHVSAAIAPTYAGALLFETGGNLTQAAAGTISTTNLAIDAWGDVTLNTAANMVTNLAASVGTGGSNKNFRFKNAPALNIGSNIAGKSGINISMSGMYDSTTPNGVIALESGGALTQSAGALLAGKGVYAEGSSVTLTQNNATGIIAGKATGGLATDRFAYTSVNTISVNKVNGFAGISHAGVADPASVSLTDGGTGIFQTTVSFSGFDSPIVSTNGGGLKLATSGMVDLSASNNVGRLTAVNTGALKFNNSGALVLGLAGGDGITTSGNQSMKIATGGLMTVEKAISAGIGNIDLEADSLALDDTVTAGIVSISPYTANRKITVGSATCDVAPCLNVTKLYNVVASTIGIGAEFDDAKPAGAIHVAGIAGAGVGVDKRNAITTRIGLLTGAGVTQTGVIAVQDLGVSAGSTVNLPLANPVTNFAAETSGASLTFNNASSLNITTLSGGSISDSSEYLIDGIDTNGGAISLSAGGAIEGSGTITGSTLNMTAASGIGHTNPLSTVVSVLNAANSGANTNIDISNVGALTIGSVTQAAGSTGSITINNDGALTVGTLVSSVGGAINLTAHSPLTVNGTVQTGSGGIVLVAHATGTPGAGDTLTINGYVLANDSGNINLSAGDNIVIPNPANVSTGDGIITKTAHLNGEVVVAPPPTTTPTPTPTPPKLSECTANPALSGCTTVLPTVSACTATPTLPGCTVVLPPLSSCVITPTLAGCSAVLPTVAACAVNPTQSGCAAVLPPLSVCVTAPTTAGCSAVLPTVAACAVNPTQSGCAAVLPALSVCITAPTTAGCSTVLPPIGSCTANPTLAGCSSVLPTLSQCVATPTLEGCSVVVPVTVLPGTPTQTRDAVSDKVNSTVNTIVLATTTSQVATDAASPARQAAGGASGSQPNKPAENSDSTDEKKDDKKTTAGPDDSGAKKNESTKKMYCN
jgi:filamentous hemagglutinin family protein